MNRKIISIAMALALIAVAALPMGVWGANNGTTLITGDVSTSTISIATFPDGGTLGSMVVNGDTSYEPDQSIVITGSGATYNLCVRDNNQETDIGHMIASTHVLETALKVKGGDLAYTSLPEEVVTALTIEDAGDLSTGTSTISNFNVQQHVTYTDDVANGYSITLYFEVAYN